MSKPLAQVQIDLLKAADIMEKRGHLIGGYGERVTENIRGDTTYLSAGKVCAMGAINVAICGNPGPSYIERRRQEIRARRAYLSLVKYLVRIGGVSPVHTQTEGAIAFWNDHRAQGKDHAVSALRAAAMEGPSHG